MGYRVDSWLEPRETVNAMGYTILTEKSKNWSIQLASAYAERGYAFPVMSGKTYLAVEAPEFAPGEITYMKGCKNYDEF